jgi:peptide/nickel transport system ATP-binding protein
MNEKLVLSVDGLTLALPHAADRAHAVEQVSFQVKAGKTLCLLGESGSGKSVIAQAIMGLLPLSITATAGRIDVLGNEILGAPAALLRRLRGASMAMIFQEPMTALNPVIRCGKQVEEIIIAHTRLSALERRSKIIEMFRQVQLPDPQRIFDAYPHELSGGQRQRIVIAIALILNPALLICDEPTTALDVTTQAEILSLIKKLQLEIGTAVLFITHDFGVVADIADEVVVLRLGAQVESGAKNQVLGHPREEYTRALLKAVPGLAAPERPMLPESNAPALLEARSISKVYPGGGWLSKRREVQAVSDVSLAIRAGETVGIVGESGSGKSTLARCIARLIDPTDGEIAAGGHAVRSPDRRERTAFRRIVQVVFQDPSRSLNPRRTVGESVIEGPLNIGVPRAQAWQRAEELMQLVRLHPEVLARYPSEFSGGQRQRICIARALACEPQVLIADEAVSALDVSVQAQVLALLTDIQERLKLGIIFITHDLRVARQICDRVIVMQHGRVVEQGTASQIFNAPEHCYTRALLAAAPGHGYFMGGS